MDVRMSFRQTAPLVRRCATALAATAFALCALGARPAAAQGIIRDAEIEETLRVYSEPVLRASGLRPEDVHLYLIDDSSINAFVAGGQNIFIHTGLILQAENPNEIIAVLAHEAGHIKGGHLARSREAMGRSMGPALISIGLGVLAIAAGAPDAGAALIAGSQQFAMGNFVRHTQAQESSADQSALSALEQSGQSGHGLITMFDREMRPYEYNRRFIPPYLLTHPAASDRIESLRPRVDAAAHRNASETADNLRRFAFMQAKLIGFLSTEGQTRAAYPPSDISQPARYARAVAYYRVSDLPNARAELNALLAADPNNPYFQELMGQILFENARAAESVPYHRRSLALAPGRALLEINLARALVAAQGREGADEAMRLLEAAVGREPDNAFAWRELASTYDLLGQEGLARYASAEQSYAIGDYQLALSFAERARQELPHSTGAYVRAGDIAASAARELQSATRRGG
jgi:predicted Zn-dependent protease